MIWPGLPILVRLSGSPVILLGEGEAAEPKRRLLERAGALVVGEDDPDARLAVVALAEEGEALAAVARLRARGVLVNAVDRPDACDFTMPAVVDRSPVLVAVATGGVSAGLAAALRQRLEALLPASLGKRAADLFASRGELRRLFPDGADRRRALATAMAPGAPLDPLGEGAVADWLADPRGGAAEPVRLTLRSPDPDELTLREARLLASADRLYHRADVPAAILDRARADAERVACDSWPGDGLFVEMAGEDGR
jgi:uroporphyrin-III C-methyltransferase/precorrin-2 dehydrogenase/sirohydrochlorin ferrochelatase